MDAMLRIVVTVIAWCYRVQLSLQKKQQELFFFLSKGNEIITAEATFTHMSWSISYQSLNCLLIPVEIITSWRH